MSDEPPTRESTPFPLFSVWCYAVIAVLLLVFVQRAVPSSVRAWAFAISIVASYALLYNLPVFGAIWLARRWRGRGLAEVLVILVASATQLVLAADLQIHGMFGFHINGFVINLLTTPEGVDSMGTGDGTMGVVWFAVLGVIAINAALWFTLKRWRPATGFRLRRIVIAIVLLGVGERITYGIAYIQAWPDLMAISSMVPGYQPFTFRSLAKKMGFQMQRRIGVNAPGADATLVYPAKPLGYAAVESPPNVIMFVCESLRADMLTPEIMPRTWAFALENQRFTRHYSGGNGTRMGMFTAFYGIPGNYWFNFLRNRRPPVLMDRVQKLGYDMRFSTSAAFSYPEFDKTILAHIPAGNLHQKGMGSGWERDRYHVGQMKKWLSESGTGSPYFLFHFFESPHARYYFPPESVIREPYLEDLNYATVDLKRDIGLIRNRYINSVHHLDSQIGEMIDTLRARKDMENTIVIITGDHGEEFMENGRWGHNSQFSEQQVRVPLVVSFPGMAPAVYDYPTSHTDLVPTLLPLLGVSNPAADYSTGENLLSPEPRLLTFADWDRIAISDGTTKAVFPINAGTQVRASITTITDRPVVDESGTLRGLGAEMVKLKDMMSRFTNKRH